MNDDSRKEIHTYTFESDQFFSTYAQKRSCEQQCSSLISRCVEIERNVFVCEMDSSLLIIIIALGVLTGILVPTFFISLYICGFYSYVSQIMNGSYKCDAEAESLQGKSKRRESDSNFSAHVEIHEDTTSTTLSPQNFGGVVERIKPETLTMSSGGQPKTRITSERHNSMGMHESLQQAVDIL
ncbi:hypothetical protein Tcan_04732 [Toxocara canis]|uniref:Uncharacterized protein n=1 Tax=Toxocara canis TaxID=6265 RepID=A0A0B2VA53_TOXCA|nr:hypothetical protein Tcan_04732 [Toxocara canis]